MRQTDFTIVIGKVTEHFFGVTLPLVFLVKVSRSKSQSLGNEGEERSCIVAVLVYSFARCIQRMCYGRVCRVA